MLILYSNNRITTSTGKPLWVSNREMDKKIQFSFAVTVYEDGYKKIEKTHFPISRNASPVPGSRATIPPSSTVLFVRSFTVPIFVYKNVWKSIDKRKNISHDDETSDRSI